MFISCSWDDGIDDKSVLRVLDKLGIVSTFFPTHLQYRDLNQYDGHEVGCHTMTHPYLNKLNREEIKNELLQSIAVIQDKYDHDVCGVAYPYGCYNEDVLSVVKDIGLTYGRAVGNVITTNILTLGAVDIIDKSFFKLYKNAVNYFIFFGHAHTLDHLSVYNILSRMLDDGKIFITLRDMARHLQSNHCFK